MAVATSDQNADVGGEQIAYRLSQQWPLGQIAREAAQCCDEVGIPSPPDLKPYFSASVGAIERAYNTAHAELMGQGGAEAPADNVILLRRSA